MSDKTRRRVAGMTRQAELSEKDISDLPIGWKPGEYGSESAKQLGLSTQEDYSLVLADVLEVPRAGGYLLTVIWEIPSDALLYTSKFGSREHLPGLEARFFHNMCLARIWRRGHPLPCLTLRRRVRGHVPVQFDRDMSEQDIEIARSSVLSHNNADTITLDGLEHSTTIGEAERLLKHLRFLKRFSAAGRRPLEEDEHSDWRRVAERAEELKQANSRLSYGKIADQLFVSRATLSRYRSRNRSKSSE